MPTPEEWLGAEVGYVFGPDDKPIEGWSGTVVGVIMRPSALIEFTNGSRTVVVLDNLKIKEPSDA